MSAASKVGDKYCPPHLSGGAIDLSLYDINNNQLLNMGTEFDDCTEVAHKNYFDVKNELSEDEDNIRKNRLLLRKNMEACGFTSYEYEWWHFDFGNVFWSRIVKRPEIFGPLFGDEEWPVTIKKD